MQLSSAHLYYGTSRYPINNPIPAEVPFAPLAGALLDEVADAIALASGCLDRASVLKRITHNVAVGQVSYKLAVGEVVIPAGVHLLGNGFSVVWK